MGAGGGLLQAGNVFRVVIQFTDPINGNHAVRLDRTDPVYTNFVDAVNRVVAPGEWKPGPLDPDGLIGGGTALLRGPISVDQSRQVKYALNRVLRGLRVKHGGVPTGVAGRVTRNVGPAVSEDAPDQGRQQPPDTSDTG
jgi:hypothetical protein